MLLEAFLVSVLYSILHKLYVEWVQHASELSRALWWRGGKRKESLQLRLWNLNYTTNSPVAPHRLVTLATKWVQYENLSIHVLSI